MRFEYVVEKRTDGKAKIYVLDTNALLILRADKLQNHTCYTIPEVLDEIKTVKHKALVEMLIDLGILRVCEASKESLKVVGGAAKTTGDVEALSETDMKLLALAIELKSLGHDVVLLTDDYTMQNLASRLNIKFQSIKTRGIEKRIKWGYKCMACGKVFKEYVKTCPVCGHKTRREVLEYESL